MIDQALTAEVQGFFEQYNKAFASIDGGRIAARYYMPTVTMRADGSIHCLQSREELAPDSFRMLLKYRGEGYRDGRFNNLEVIAIGGRSVLATMHWELLPGDGSVIRGRRQSYNLVRVGRGWQILVSTFHVT
jgi:hypothetical protein